jgi:Tol biopolymer transport system component
MIGLRAWHAAALLTATTAHAQLLTPTLREVTAIPGVAVDEAVRMPNGHVVLYTVRDSIFAWDIGSRHARLVAAGFDGELTISRAGDRIAYASPSGTSDVIEVLSIDPHSGAAVGAPRRISALTGDYPSFSPDGKLLAFAADRGALNIVDLVVVQTSGGPPRLLSHFDKKIWNLSWSADAKWIFLKVGQRGDTVSAIKRVPIAGGPGETMLEVPSSDVAALVSGDVAFYASSAEAVYGGHLAFRSAAGAHGEISIPAGSLPVGDDWSARALLKRRGTSFTTSLLNLATGAGRDLAATTRLPYGGAVWSRDGRRMALVDSSDGHFRILLSSDGGTTSRAYPVSLRPATASAEWSPDGQLLAYYTGMGTPAIAVLDPATGDDRVLFSATDADYLSFAWRPDGRSLVVLKQVPGAQQHHWEVYQVDLDGMQRKVRDIPQGKYCCVAFLTVDLLVGGADGIVSNEYDLLSSAGTDLLTLLRGNGRGGFPGISPDGKWLVFQIRFNRAARVTAVEVIGTNGLGSRIIPLPFTGMRRFENVVFHPDGQHVILVGQSRGDSIPKVFLVPLDGSAVRALATLRADALSGRVDISPDGKAVIYTAESSPTTTIYEVDIASLRKVVRP